MEIKRTPHTAMHFQWIVADRTLSGFEFRRSQDKDIITAIEAFLKKVYAILLGKVFNNVTKKDNVIVAKSTDYVRCVALMNLIVNEPVGLMKIALKSFYAVDYGFP
jgi:hypothetical protein